MSDLPVKTIIQGLLFVADEPLSLERLAQAFEEDLPPERLARAVDELINEYEELGRAFSATLVVLVTLGFVKAIIMLIVFVLVMSIESHVLQPLVLGKAVEIHPLIVLLGISAGAIIAGITGALFAIPLVAFVNGCIKGAELDEAERARRSRGLSLPRSRPEASGSPFRWGRRGAKLDA